MLSSIDIVNEIFKLNIRISPFLDAQLGPNSYDVRLGSWFWRQNSFENMGNSIIYPATRDMWAKEPSHLNETFDDVLWLEPGETVLAHTLETVGTFGDIVATMAAKSTAGRSCIEVCKCAGFGDVGFFSKWTMEITNNSHRHGVGIPVGESIAQMVFQRLESAPIETYADTGRYTLANPNDWSPEMMLPKTRRES